MICNVCQHENEPDASFCSNCGNSLAVTCPNCGATATPGSKFCRVCGHNLTAGEQDADAADDDLRRYIPEELLEKMRTARAGKTMAGERRTVTMLFADVEGSTAAAETLDPEDWAEVINGAFERLIQPVYRYEGTLARLAGDSVLAFFGAPVAHEDDPERAVMAALEMLEAIPSYSAKVQKQWGIPIQVRVGINTGLVVVGEVGSDLRVEYTALGDAVNLAARMEQTAAPGTIQVTESTYELVSPLFEIEDVGTVKVKGKAKPVQAYSILSRKTDTAQDEGGAAVSPLVGRDTEMGHLNDLISSVLSGSGGIATILGDAGLGKSRLVSELRTTNRERIGPWWATDLDATLGWATGKALSYNSSVPYGPIIDLLKDCLRLRDDETGALSQTKLTDLAESLTDNADNVVPYLANLLGLELSEGLASKLGGLEAPELQRRTFAAVVQLVESAARQRPTVIVFEDLHWADPVSLALIQELMQVTDRSMLLLLITMRPYREKPSWQIHETAAREYDHRHTPIELAPLAAAQTLELVNSLIGSEESGSNREEIASRSQGNPFFVQEFLNSLVDQSGGDSPDEEMRVPTTINGLLTARLDRLEPEARTVVQIASVIGREFRFDEVEHLIDDSIELRPVLADLMRRKLLEERVRLPERLYGFRHALLQETAYGSLLRRSRKDLHGKIASYLETTHPDETQVIADHLIEAHETKRALPYVVRAAQKAARAMSLHDAIKLYIQALQIAEPEDVGLVRQAHEGLGTAYTMIPDLSLAASTFQEMLALGETESEPSIQVTALNRLGFATAILGGELKQAKGYLEKARALAVENGDDMGLAEYHMNSCMIATQQGDMEAAAEHDAGTAAMGVSIGSHALRIGGLVQRAITLVVGGFFEDGLVAVDEARRVAEEEGDELSVGVLDSAVMPYMSLQQGHLPGALDLAKTGAQLAEEYGSRWAPQAWMGSAYLAIRLGSYEDALALSSQGLHLSDLYGQPHFSAASVGILAETYAAVGLVDKVEESYQLAMNALAAPSGAMLASIAWGGLGRAMLTMGDWQRAVEYFTAAMKPSAAQALEKAPSLLGLAEAYHRDGTSDEAKLAWSQASDAIHKSDLAHLYPRLALLRARIGDDNPEEKLERLRVAIVQAESMGLDPVLWELQAESAKVLTSVGRQAEAAASHNQAEATISRMAGSIVDQSLRESFLNHTQSQLRPTKAEH